MSDFDDYLSRGVGGERIQLNELVKWDFGILWRSRIDLNDARINAEEVDLDEFLASLLEEQKQAKASLSGYLKSDEVIAERDRQIQELQITVKNHHEQFDALKSHFEVLLKAIAMNLNALKGERKPDETKEVNGVMVTFRNYDDNLTHHHKTIIIENVQRAIAEEAKKLKGVNLKDFSFDDIPF